MLWLCLHLPRLPLEVFTRGSAAPGPLVVIEGSRRSVLTASAGAEASGVCPGMTLRAALALVPGLCARERDEAAEAKALAGLASWAGQFTPLLSLAPFPFPGVLLEVEGSLGLFQGVEGLAAKVEEGIEGLGYRASLALAPTPLAAELLARAGRRALVGDPRELPARLAPLGLGVLGLPSETLEALAGMGVRTLGELGRLPRPGLTRRFGRELSETLDRALGKAPDPRPAFEAPPRFGARLELTAEVSAAEPLLFAAHRLLLELEGFLRSRGSGIRQFRLDLFHRGGGSTRVEIGLATPGRDSQRLLNLLRERLGRSPLPEPVSALGLTAAELSPLTPRGRDLFAGERGGEEGEVQLAERLRARLGEEAVQGLRLAADHRPERAFCRNWVHRAETPRRGASAAFRPLWLLPEPQEFPFSQLSSLSPQSPGVPASQRPSVPSGLTLLTGPEQIESGWWDGGDVLRDYFVAQDPHGSRLWIFRERKGEGRWFLHGIFG